MNDFGLIYSEVNSLILALYSLLGIAAQVNACRTWTEDLSAINSIFPWALRLQEVA